MPPPPLALPLSPQVFAILAPLIEEKLGIAYSPDDRDLLAGKISTRAVQAGFESLLDYYYFLRYDPAGPDELAALADHLVVGETYFFRELDALEATLDRIVIPRLGAAPRTSRPLRIWSAACATGEEPLTLAMLLDERGLLDRAEILATDLSARALHAAKEGRFGPRSWRRPELHAAARRHLVPQPGGGYRVTPALVAGIRWRRLNLVDPKAVAAMAAEFGPFDLILCRNVLIYFNDATVRPVVHSLGEALRGGGVLLVGVSESLLRFGTALECQETAGAFYYEKVAS
jgi:chemotaxis protein methyltransferase CheR